MIDQEKITHNWLEKVSKENRNADTILVEKKSNPEAFFFWYNIFTMLNPGK
jgi:hypothetical protein